MALKNYNVNSDFFQFCRFVISVYCLGLSSFELTIAR